MLDMLTCRCCKQSCGTFSLSFEAQLEREQQAQKAQKIQTSSNLHSKFGLFGRFLHFGLFFFCNQMVLFCSLILMLLLSRCSRSWLSWSSKSRKQFHALPNRKLISCHLYCFGVFGRCLPMFLSMMRNFDFGAKPV